MHCLACGAPLAGRVDKRFCDDACRSGFHNQKHREQDAFVYKINKILKKNRKILSICYNRGLQSIFIHKLLEEGFLFGYCTHIESIEGKRGYINFCYDYGYKTVNKNQVEIVYKYSKEKSLPL
ncbi:MAG: DUF2116 family Zn-ribbon domain-containing protein [Bacteroidetes bacterium]|nr:DUF2116 family Zn-ribbon domain-containing protein [Bacteroidota bacterium]